MATTTPNFGWAVPTSTDLVKDGAVAIETLGDAIDASLVDLKGGTTGQVLSKASNTDMDFTWVTDAAGDITGVTAGTGISGGGTSGTVTVTNSMATAIDAKGDLIGGTGADAFARLAVGANGTVLTADSAEATGLKWATPAGGSSFAGAYVTNSTNTTVANNTLTTLAFNQETYDTNAYHDNSTNNSRLTAPAGKAGYYLVTAGGQWDVNSSGRREMYVHKNGVYAGGQEVTASSVAYPTHSPSFPVYLAEGDYLEVKLYQSSGGNVIVYGQNFQASYLGA
jgi:hypothetical protein